MMRILYYIFVFALFAAPLMADNDAGTVSPFSMGAGARELSLGGNGQAICDMATAAYWNPSQLVSAQYLELGVFHSYLYDNTAAYQYLGVVVPTLDYGNFALGVFRLGISDIERRDENNILLYDFSDNRQAYYLAYARHFSGFDMGIGIYLEQHSIDNLSATSSPGINYSVSKQFRFFGDFWKTATINLVGRNLIKPSMKLVNEKISYPTEIDLGMNLMLHPFNGLNHSALITVGLSKTSEIGAVPGIGVEYSFNEMIYLRGGLDNNNFTFGTGLGYKGVKFDYAMIERELGFLHMFTLSTSFGQSREEKYKIRAENRESDFNNIMADRLNSQNKLMVQKLIDAGKKQLDDGDILSAGGSFDKALFLARSSGFDTTEVSKLSIGTAERLDEVNRKYRYGKYLDSAQTRYAKEDIWGARHFANMALAEFPNSHEAQLLIEVIESDISNSYTRDEKIERQLWGIDSLISYGLLGEASLSVSELMQYEPDNNLVKQAYRKVRFEKWFNFVDTEYALGNYDRVLIGLDSALEIFPGHKQCLNIKQQIIQEIKLQNTVAEETITETKKVAQLSPELEKKISVDYETAQSEFEKGNLLEAIKYWESVERLAPDYQSVKSYLVNAYKYVGVEYYGKNLFDEALEVWRKAVRLEPENSEIQNYIKRTSAEVRKLKELADE